MLSDKSFQNLDGSHESLPYLPEDEFSTSRLRPVESDDLRRSSPKSKNDACSSSPPKSRGRFDDSSIRNRASTHDPCEVVDEPDVTDTREARDDGGLDVPLNMGSEATIR